MHHEEYINSGEYKFYRSIHDNDPMELEADAFAAHLLMPKDMLKIWQSKTSNITELAKIFGVSMQAITKRPSYVTKFGK